MVKFLLNNIDLKHPVLLDIGSGKGAFLHFLKKEGVEGEGLEINQNAIEFSQKNFGLKIYRGWLGNWKTKKKYDVITAIDLIEHTTNPLKSLKQMGELLKRKGHLLISTPDYQQINLKRGVKRYFKLVHTYYFTKITLSSLIQQAGFKIIKTQKTKSWGKKTGSLNIIARKIKNNKNIVPLRDNAEGLIKEFQKAKRRYFFSYLVFKLGDYISYKFKRLGLYFTKAR